MWRTDIYLKLLRTLFSLKKQNDYPIYSMSYYSDYGFDEFIKRGATNDEDLRRFIKKCFTKKRDAQFNTPNSGCTAFIAKSAVGNFLYARTMIGYMQRH